MKRSRAARLGLTRRGWVFLAASLVAIIWAYGIGLRELLYVGILLVVLPLGALLWVWWGRPRLAVDRVFSPHVIEAGSTANVTLTVRNLSTGRSRPARWTDAAPWGNTDERDLPSLQPRGARFAARGNSVAVGYELTPPRRGVFPIGPLSIEVADALGLARASLTTGEVQQIVVTPQVVPLADTGLSASAGDGEAQLVQRKAAGDEDDAITREYRSGDAMRRVHWRASARHGDLMVRQEEQRSLPEARIIIDTHREGYLDAEFASVESPAFEWAVRMLASATVHLRRGGFAVGVEETGPAQLPEVEGRRQGTSDEEFLTGLATLQLTDPSAVLGTVPEPKGRGGKGPLVAIVGTPDEATVEWLLKQRRGGDLAVAFMVRPVSSFDLLDRSFGLGQEPLTAATRLVDAGWLVVDVRDDDDHSAVWDAVVIESGRARAGS